MKVARRGISSAVIAAAIVVVIAACVVAYAVYTDSGRTTTTTTTSSSSSSPSMGRAPLISFSADAYTAEANALLNGFSQSTGASVAPVKSGGSFADANQIAAGAPDDVFISVALSATGPRYLKNLSSNWAIGFATDQMVIAYSNATSSSSSGGTVVALGNAAAETLSLIHI